MAETPDREEIRDYILGRLAPQSRDAIAERILEDEDAFARAREVEDDLVDALARGDLTPQEELEVRQFIAASGQSKRVVMARALARRERRTYKGKTFVGVFLAIAATLLLGLVGAFFYYQNERLARQEAMEQNQGAPKEPVVFAFAVPAGTTRGGSNVAKLKTPPGVDMVRLKIELEPGYTSYDIQLRTTGGKPVADAHTAEFDVPVTQLTRGRYEIAVMGNKPGTPAEPLNFSYFEVE